ncbi:MAG: hypothetical protein AAF182_04775 [Pseudomonadota bacterium]
MTKIDMVDKEKVNVIKADNSLQGRVGSGPLDEQVVERAEQAMEEDKRNIDFAPLAKEFLDELSAAVKKAKSGELTKDQAVQAMTTPVMQLKANAKTFNYELVGSLANVMLSFLEAIKQMDNDVIEIVGAHHKTLTLIVMQKMKGDGGAAGQQMEAELKAACKRYFTRGVKK